MSETTDQMSLLDAIGITAPKETKKTKKDQPVSPDAPSSQAAKKPARKRKFTDEKAKIEKPSVDEEIGQSATVSSPEQTAAIDTTIDNAGTEPQRATSAAATVTLDQHLCFALYSANHAMHGVYKTLLKDLGLTYPQFLAMTVLWETNNVPVGTLTGKLQLDTNTLTPLLKRLEGMDLLTRTRNKKDERQVIVKLTRKGRALQKKTENFSSCIFSATGLPLEEIVDLQSRIMKLRDNLRNAEAES